MINRIGSWSEGWHDKWIRPIARRWLVRSPLNESKIMKTKIKCLFALLAAAVVTVTTAPPSRAAGLLIADGGFGGVLELKEQDVRVTINNGVAVTKVTQVFHN